MNTTKLAIIGGGPGGYVAAFKAADLGLDVTLIDEEVNPGGVCLYRGCIPSKALLHIAKLLNESREAEKWGVKFAEPEIDLDRLREWKNEVITKMTGGLGQLVKARKLKHIQGRARFVDAHTLHIDKADGDQDQLQFENAILATGSRPAVPGVFRLATDRIMDSTGALELNDIPTSMLVVGGGIIGMELGQAYAALGTKVSVVEMLPGLIPPADRDLVKPLQNKVAERFEEVMLNTQVTQLEEGPDGLTVHLQDLDGKKSAKTYNKILLSVGRVPNSGDIGLETTAIAVDERNYVQVDGQMRTAEPSVFAIGDLVGAGLAHTASHQGAMVSEVIAGHDKLVFEPNAIPSVVYTDPEIAWCGLTEEEAKKIGRRIKVARFPWAASGRATTQDTNDGVTKLLIDPETDRVLGVGIAGSGAGELIAEGVLAIEMAALASDIQLSIHPHPTLSETVMEAAEVHYGQSPHLYAPKRS
ncbi:MAG: dihydrolipoyl dehydrogenase [Gemmatimonadetes bacterium]|jgi:dihydrolipoamide dehydrogenase|nr:dihydrolipoyl dehydrogenase [Gemmatimonadota bacterium]MBT5447833.1 dihydrolipoyl dehydrogenase [Gemmatimonadota bacterium]MBT5803548.1 dihydrolipoyl dehydrogenase [Gemmatimonadota bacterium]MBT6619414.1 dihydrolipoyl dehydrogenase [Gemmatimonadota bacterium]MBT6903137.1 dihydrolipoyl dehydrogenase [Gemmatimonadota bacterium]